MGGGDVDNVPPIPANVNEDNDLDRIDSSMPPSSIEVNGVKIKRTEVKKSGFGLALLSFQTLGIVYSDLGVNIVDTSSGKRANIKQELHHYTF
ncbi:hypothetical protein WG66_005704 [Moniliophthora roreri]|nr:hypothetical protein WG66_005704 [Moniliophthora roreri]